MNKKFIIFSVGALLEILSLILLIPAGIAFVEIQSKTFPGIIFNHKLLGFIIAIVSSLVCGRSLKILGKKELSGTGIREGFAIVAFGWIILTFFGSIPLWTYFLSQSEAITISTIFRTLRASTPVDSFCDVVSIVGMVFSLSRKIRRYRSPSSPSFAVTRTQ